MKRSVQAILTFLSIFLAFNSPLKMNQILENIFIIKVTSGALPRTVFANYIVDKEHNNSLKKHP